MLESKDWRDVPLLSALSFGVASVEADVWLINKTLFVSATLHVLQILKGEVYTMVQVGHEPGALTKTRTLDSLYVQPLLQILGRQNPKDPFTVNDTSIK